MLRPTCRMTTRRALGWLPLVAAVSLFPLVVSAQTSDAADILERVNALRRQNRLAPLELNDALGVAAQRHSQDMAATENVDHTGSDGSTSEERIRASGYGPNVLAWGENIYGGGTATVDDAWEFWTTSTAHRNNLLSERYREIGIGAAASGNGTYYTLVFGARSGVLPFFIDRGILLDDPNVTLTLSNEEAAPGGSGGSMGRAVDVRLGEGEDLSRSAWQPWQRAIAFTLSNTAGPRRLTVEYRDARGTIASYFRVVTLRGAALQATVIPTGAPSATASLPPTPSPTDTPTPKLTDTPPPADTPTSIPTSTPSLTLAATANVPPSATVVSVALVTPETGPVARPEPDEPVRLAVTAAPDRSPLEAMVERGWSDAPVDVLSLALGLLAVALVIGAWLAVRRSADR